MHVEFLVEEPSAEAALQSLVPRILGPEHAFEVHVFQGVQDLMGKLPNRLRAYSTWIPDDWYIVVLRDTDRADCHQLKTTLDTLATQAGLVTKSAAGTGRFHVMNRLAVEELEAWFSATSRHSAPRIPVCLPAWASRRDIARLTRSGEAPKRHCIVCCNATDTIARVCRGLRPRGKFRATWTRTGIDRTASRCFGTD